MSKDIVEVDVHLGDEIEICLSAVKGDKLRRVVVIGLHLRQTDGSMRISWKSLDGTGSTGKCTPNCFVRILKAAHRTSCPACGFSGEALREAKAG